MKVLESLRLALRALTANKLRAILTMLGIIIGVGAVITLLSVGEGVQSYITAQFQSIGTNIFFVAPGSFEHELDKPAYITRDDAEALANAELVPDVLHVAPTASHYGRLTIPGHEKNTEIIGVTPEYTLVRDWLPAIGVFINFGDEASQARVVVLGQIVAAALFPANPNPIDEIVRLNGVPFRVIGIMAERGGSSFGSEDDGVFIPLSTHTNRLFPRRTPQGKAKLSVLYVQAVDGDRMNAAITEASQLLRQRHNILPGEYDDFSIISQSDLIGTFEQITSVITVFLGAIAGISLLVGGIGIMNIMLVSVTERTREIGLRKAVGARRRDILWQFLIEAMLLSLIGGIIGIILGGVGSTVISYFMREQDFHAVITLDSITLATLFSAAVGLFFGIYPAQRAAALNPIDALRYE
ncbi:MAG: ABC transporter permease [Chloroflexota bacterium]|nr:ABC transporter permease [Chloroflexota bacterium]